MIKLKYLLALYFLIPFCFNAYAEKDKLIEILEEELKREMEVLKKQEVPAYYIDYRVNEIHSVRINSFLGNITGKNSYKGRILSIAVRVGDYELDNTHNIKDSYVPGSYGISNIYIPYEDNEESIKKTLWAYTDKAYKKAVSRYSSIKDKMKEKEDTSELNDFTKEDTNVYIENRQSETIGLVDTEEWEDKMNKFTAPFLVDTSIVFGQAKFSYSHERKYFVSSEGTKIAQNFNYSQLSISAATSNKKGELLPVTWSYYSFLPDSLPGDDIILSDVNKRISMAENLKNADEAEAYTGPAILSQQAAGVFFHEIFGHRIEGDRLLKEDDGHTFKEKKGERILPKDISVVFKPIQNKYEDTDLYGFYKYDDQGVKGQRVKVVEDGVLKEFLRTRKPYDKNLSSNGHSRAQAGQMPVSRQSNMFVTTDKPKSDAELRKKLINEAKKQDKEYGYYFKRVVGGFTYTNRYSPSVFNITPIEVYRIYVDGRPDELVRGVSLIGTPLLMFSNIEAAGDKYGVFNGYCGAESGSVPVSTIAPPLFVKQVETQLKPVYKIEMPVLPMPKESK